MMLGPMLMAGGTPADVVNASSVVGEGALRGLGVVVIMLCGIALVIVTAWLVMPVLARRAVDREVSSPAGAAARAETQLLHGDVRLADDGHGGAVSFCMLCDTGRHYTAWELAWLDSDEHRCDEHTQVWPSDTATGPIASQ